jgi:hypothetical protein
MRAMLDRAQETIDRLVDQRDRLIRERDEAQRIATQLFETADAMDYEVVHGLSLIELARRYPWLREAESFDV